MQEGAMSQTFLDVFERDDLCSKLVEQPAYRHYPIANQRSLNQRAAHEGHNMLSGEVRAIQQARERQEHAKNEKKNKKGRDNSIAHTSDLGSKARSSKERYRKEQKEHLASQENKNKTNKPKKKDDDTKEKLDKSNKPKKKDDDIKQLEKNRDNFIKALYSGKKASTVPSVTKPPLPAKKERVQVENKACTPGEKKRPIVKKTPIEKKKVSFDDALTPPCIVIAKKLQPQKLQPQKPKFRIPKMEVKQAASAKDVWRMGTPTPKPKPEDLLESPGTSSSESTTDKKDLKSNQERLKIWCESEEFDPKVVLNLKKEAVEELEQQSDIEREQRTKQYDKMLMDKYKKRENNT